VSSAITSLRGATGASDLRAWLEREFTTEARSVLETPRFSYGIAFVDDLHFCAQQYDRQDMRLLENRCEALLKGLTDGTPLFNIRRNPAVRSTVYYGLHAGSYDTAFETNVRQSPVLHQEINTDLRMQTVHLADDFVLQRIGLISAATGQFSDLVSSSCFTQILPHFCAVGLPSMNANELHTALIAGACVCMSAGTFDSSMVEALRNEIVDLSRFTMSMCTKMIGAHDATLTCPIERAVRSLVVIDVSLVARFCTSLRFGCSNVANPGGLLQLYTHEWKRYFLDPLPDGAQRDRIVQLLNDQLNTIDEKRWSVSIDWLKALQEDFAAYKDRVWTDSRVFEALVEEPSPPAPSTPALADAQPSTPVAGIAEPAPEAATASTRRSILLAGGRSSLIIDTNITNSSLKSTPGATPGTATTTAALSNKSPRRSVTTPGVTTTAGATSTRTSFIGASASGTPIGAAGDTSAPALSLARTESRVEEPPAPVPAPLHRLYLPVELDRAGTERSLYSGTWDHTKKEYRPVQSAEEIAQGEISKVLDFTNAVGGGDVRKVLYPAAICLVLRMVRILSVAGKHVLLAGYYGTTRLTALHLAAKICNLQPITFDVKLNPGVVEAQPSDSALYATDFVRFLKSVVYRAAGLRVRSASHADEALLTSDLHSAIVAYEIVPAQKLLVAIQSCQQLSDRDRITLLNLIDYEDPGYLFSDAEILGKALLYVVCENSGFAQSVFWPCALESHRVSYDCLRRNDGGTARANQGAADR
jgi:hypothetical protein